MTWLDQIQVWEINNPDGDYFVNIPVIAPEIIDRETLFDFLIDECGTFQPIWGDSERFREEILIFFLTHMWNIEELAKTMLYEYDPLTNRNWSEDVISEDTGVKNTETDTHTTDVGTKNTEKDTHLSETNDITTKSTENMQNVHYVSAYNQNESPQIIGYTESGNPIYKYDDVEEWRESTSITRNGTENDTKVNDTNTTGEERSTNSGDKNVTGEENTKNTGVTNITHKGNDGTMYQEYIKKQRQVVEFNLYKWICNHFADECFSHIW